MAKYTKKERKTIKKTLLVWKVLAYTGMTKKEYIKYIDSSLSKANANCHLCDVWDSDEVTNKRTCNQCPLAYMDSFGEIQSCYADESYFRQFNNTSNRIFLIGEFIGEFPEVEQDMKMTRQSCARLIVKQMEDALKRGRPEF